MTTLALDSDQIGKIGVGLIIALVVIGALLSLIITAVFGRIIILVAVVALGVVVWQQRSSLQDKIDKCQLNATFFGVHVSAPDDVVAACLKKSS
jgi:hypothetical protein